MTGSLAPGLPGHPRRLVHVRRTLQAADADLPDVGHREVAVQRRLERARGGVGVAHGQVEVQDPAHPHGEREGELVREAPARGGVRRQVECRAQAAVALGRDRGDRPRQDAREAVQRRLGRAGLRPEPREADRHPAADRLACLEAALRAHPEDRLLAPGLKVGNVRPLEVDDRLAVGGGQDQPLEAARPLLESCAVGESFHGAEFSPSAGRSRGYDSPWTNVSVAPSSTCPPPPRPCSARPLRAGRTRSSWTWRTGSSRTRRRGRGRRPRGSGSSWTSARPRCSCA